MADFPVQDAGQAAAVLLLKAYRMQFIFQKGLSIQGDVVNGLPMEYAKWMNDEEERKKMMNEWASFEGLARLDGVVPRYT